MFCDKNGQKVMEEILIAAKKLLLPTLVIAAVLSSAAATVSGPTSGRHGIAASSLAASHSSDGVSQAEPGNIRMDVLNIRMD
jgi:hypothetical protein